MNAKHVLNLKRISIIMVLLLTFGSAGHALAQDPTPLPNRSEPEGAGFELVGEYDFELVHNTDKTSINLISLPFVLPEDLVMASDLSEYFGAAVDLISLWHAETQGYEDYIPIMPTWNDFELETGGVYFVSAKESKTITFIGVVPETAEPYELQINPDRGGANSIMAPLNRVDLKKASELWQEIQNIESLGYWSAETQEYVLYIPDEPSGDFEIKQGMAYSVDVSECTFWQP